MQHTAHQVGRTSYDIAVPKAPVGFISRCLHPLPFSGLSLFPLFDRMILIEKTWRDAISAAVRQLIFGKLFSSDQSSFFQHRHFETGLAKLMRHSTAARSRTDDESIIDLFHSCAYLEVGRGSPPSVCKAFHPSFRLFPP